MDDDASSYVEFWKENGCEIVDHDSFSDRFWKSERADVAGLEDDVGVEGFYEFRDFYESADRFRAKSSFLGDDVVICIFEKIVGAGVDEGVRIFFVNFEQGGNKVFCVKMNACFLIVDGVSKNQDVHV